MSIIQAGLSIGHTIATLLGSATSNDVVGVFAANAVPVTGKNGQPVYSQNSLGRLNPQPLATYPQYFQRARPVKLTVKQTIRPMEHPLETGAITTDHVIILPNEIEIEFIAQAKDYKAVYQQMNQLFTSVTVMAVMTKTNSYGNMFIYEMPHEETTDQFNAITFRVRFKQILFAANVSSGPTQGPPYSAADPTQAQAVSQGVVTPQPLPTPVTNANGVVADPLSSTGFSQMTPNPLTAFTPGINLTAPLSQAAALVQLPTVTTQSLDTLKNFPGAAAIAKQFPGM